MTKIMFKFKGQWINKINLLFVEVFNDNNITFHYASGTNKELTLGDFTQEDFKELDKLMQEINS
ncbi:hypothetical protein [Spiroplasma sp. AdecLV25b]|uniref:hypothetical protein n=1 Tax=Spiroplasma sp. AdecLV25b TaxID=3027162 RepID=UPI0027DF1E1C|nr:hypothetical protein [Spiroplasma sp. AdecLV25b]